MTALDHASRNSNRPLHNGRHPHMASGLSGFHSAQCGWLVNEHIDIACKKENPRKLA